MNSFKSEKLMCQLFRLEQFHAKLRYRDWESWKINEAKGLFGIPDQIVVFWKPYLTGKVVYRTVACEMKRENWQRALTQAYRYKSFAHYSIVILDAFYVHRAKKALDEFRNANIGLAGLSCDGILKWYYCPRFQIPYSEPMTRTFHKKYFESFYPNC
ncbi:MAG: hypothetical protein Q8O92_10090 [Candidatus Latescibacter sp.]|nr:hypothetical protein [Candidatus Latescibacter sp.]